MNWENEFVFKTELFICSKFENIALQLLKLMQDLSDY